MRIVNALRLHRNCPKWDASYSTHDIFGSCYCLLLIRNQSKIKAICHRGNNVNLCTNDTGVMIHQAFLCLEVDRPHLSLRRVLYFYWQQFSLRYEV